MITCATCYAVKQRDGTYRCQGPPSCTWARRGATRVRLLIHAEIEKLVSEWRHRAVELRKEAAPTEVDDMADAGLRELANQLNDCADELEKVNYDIEHGRG